MISNTGVVSAAAPPNEAAYARLALKPQPIEVVRDEEPSEEEELEEFLKKLESKNNVCKSKRKDKIIENYHE